jgi:PBSX family phage terminase large subunit
MEIKNTYEPTYTQTIAHKQPHRYKLFGGAMGGGKSRWLCEEAKDLSLKYPGNRGILCRYHLTDFKNSTLKTLLECLPAQLIAKHNQAEHTIKLINGSEIIYMGMAEEENISKLKSMEIGWFAIDEASEVPKDHFLLFQSRLRRKLSDGSHPPFYGLLASNPEDCWLKDYFVLGGGGEDAVFIPSLPRDNPYLPSDYENQLRKTYPDDWIKRYLEGSWDELSAGDVVIPSDWVRMAINRELPIENKPLIASDIARFGDDEIVIYFGKGNTLLEQDITQGKSLMETVGRLKHLKEKKKAKLIVVDDASLGGGVTDRLREQKERVLAINGGTKAFKEDQFANLKTEMWWHARDLFREGKVSILNDPILIRQLSAVKYLYRSNGKIMIEPKKEVKMRLGQSPDRADALILLLWGAKHIKDPARDFARHNPITDFFKTKTQNSYGWDNFNKFPHEVISG